jgi:hypothetical protein
VESTLISAAFLQQNVSWREESSICREIMESGGRGSPCLHLVAHFPILA